MVTYMPSYPPPRMLLASCSVLLTVVIAPAAELPLRGVHAVIAHRGSSEDRPENTLASFRRAIEAGASAVEVDVRTTRDDQLVVLHDATLDRTTDGSGPVGEATLREIRRLDAGGWFDPTYLGQRVPTLRQVLELCRGRVDVLLDLKEQGESYARRVADEVKRHGEPERTIAGVRSVEQAERFRRLLPGSPQLGFIPDPDHIEAFAEAGVETIRLWPRWFDQAPELAGRVRRAGRRLHINGKTGSIDETRQLLQFGPDSLMTDNPARLLCSLAMLADDSAGR